MGSEKDYQEWLNEDNVYKLECPKCNKVDCECCLLCADKDKVIDQLNEQNDDLMYEIKELYSSAPCPKCGYGISGQCYGCEIKQLKQQLADKDKILSNLVTSLQNCKDCRFEPDKIICITERAIHQAALERQKGSE